MSDIPDQAPAWARPQNPDRDTTVMTVEVEKTTLQLIDATWLAAQDFGVKTSRKQIVADILNEWAKKRMHARSVEDRILSGNLRVLDTDVQAAGEGRAAA
jgi:hypothetical protein